MPRQAHLPAEIHAEPGPLPAAHAVTLAEEQKTNDIEREAAFEAAKTIGQIEALLFSATVAEKAIVETFIKLKQNKAYRSIQFRDLDGNMRRVADLSEFCERFLKKSYRRVQEMASNYHLIGADLFDTAEKIGFKQQDYRALKALPADDQEAIKAAMQTDDRDQIIELMQELAVRHASQSAALKAKAADANETAAARDDVIKNKQTRLDALEEENHKLKRRVETTTPDELALEIRKEADRIAFVAEHEVRANLYAAFSKLREHTEKHGGEHGEFMLGLIAQIELAADIVRGEFGLLKSRPDGDSTPYWERESAAVLVN